MNEELLRQRIYEWLATTFFTLTLVLQICGGGVAHTVGDFGSHWSLELTVSPDNPFWIPVIIAFLIRGGLWVRRRRLPKPGHCVKCGYDLTGNVSGQCPECGEKV